MSGQYQMGWCYLSRIPAKLHGPLIVNVQIVAPTVSMVNTQSMTPLAVAATMVAPDLRASLPIDPLVVTVTKVAPVVDLGPIVAPKVVTVTLVTPTVSLV